MKKDGFSPAGFGGRLPPLLLTAALAGAVGVLSRRLRRLRRTADDWDRSFDAVSEGIFILDRDLTVVRHNRAFAELLGKSPGEILGRKCYELMHGTACRPDNCVTCAAAEGRSAAAEYHEPFLGKHLYISADATRDDRGEVESIIHTVRDISGQREAEQKVRDGLAFRQTILDAIPNPVFYKDREGVYLGCNRAFAELVIGRPREEVVGKTSFDIAPPELARIYHRKDAELVGNPGVQEYESQVLFADGTLRDVMFSKATFLDKDGSVAGIVGVIVDISERKAYEQELERLNVELQGYAHTVSHDLKNPIAKIAMAFELLQEGLEELPPDHGGRESMAEAVSIGRQSVERTVDLIDDLLMLAEAGTPREVVPVDVGAVVDEVLSERAPEIGGRGMEVEVGPGLGTVRAAPVHVYQVFDNLVRNSLQHNTAPGPRLEILRLEGGEGEYRFLVRDNGPGIPEGLIGRVFQPFVRGPQTGSTGIGLSIVARIIENYGGSIEAYNDDGACFEFTLRDYPSEPLPA